jgi:hypothetical protein
VTGLPIARAMVSSDDELLGIDEAASDLLLHSLSRMTAIDLCSQTTYVFETFTTTSLAN